MNLCRRLLQCPSEGDEVWEYEKNFRTDKDKQKSNSMSYKPERGEIGASA